jgi:hypothetical protein
MSNQSAGRMFKVGTGPHAVTSVEIKPVLILRLASAWALLTSALHTALFLTYAPKHGPDEIAVVEAMKSHVFRFGGTPLTYWGMYFGYGWLSTLTDFAEGVLLWQLATIAKSAPLQIRSILALLLMFNIGHIVVVSQYFFRAPLINDVPLTILLAVTIFLISRKTPAAA